MGSSFWGANDIAVWDIGNHQFQKLPVLLGGLRENWLISFSAVP